MICASFCFWVIMPLLTCLADINGLQTEKFHLC
uniref:Uncharacterized protein n=1 Tax=Rhizophora mucronata TaxID=61149 RepID=A0A2P2NMA4_RHIMU